VLAFHGRVGCDTVSKSEIVVPIFFGDRAAAVLDIDSTEVRGVDEIDRAALEQVSRFVSSRIAPIGWPKNPDTI
jgi:L-methionine (R)-S-oxide reductase